ncbi:hypothetical protein EDC39_11187 [Geothermobacter ehrlichii]|uniref:Uncharacterized protein n=1 Tax=Geothermobacter ehrlichii TaxID=213224 RepID=A0A5D3WI54_9BACT|nr:hypothetical protein [Geothermobacter ehrlichii]TYO97157.1 hypothetical protein EDC39_11187 [Geothermobacter ehrlichii]
MWLAKPRSPGGGGEYGIFLGVLLFLSCLFQTLGLERTSSSNTGFLTGINVIWVPLLPARC